MKDFGHHFNKCSLLTNEKETVFLRSGKCQLIQIVQTSESGETRKLDLGIIRLLGYQSGVAERLERKAQDWKVMGSKPAPGSCHLWLVRRT